MKRITAIFLIFVFAALSLSGCGVIRSFASYWDGMTKSQTIKYVQDTLEEKYGEEFIVNYIGTHSGEHYTEVVGRCSPKSDKTIAFDFEVNHFSEIRQLIDNYIQM